MYFIENHVLNRISEFIFPSSTYCVCCGKFVDKNSQYSICDFCFERMGFGHIYVNLKKVENKLAQEMKLDSMRSAVWYGAFTRVMVEDYKDGRKTYLARTISQIMYERIATDPSAYEILNCDLMVPAPVSPESKRGFNQSEKIAGYLSKSLEIPVSDCLIKKEGGTSQRRLKAAGRMMELRNTISVAGTEERADTEEKAGTGEKPGTLKGKNILLIDDVFTTGSTMNECARALKEAGASHVHGLTFATKNRYAFGRFSDSE